jgi:predicted enzyme related to lactoylglutathione lyase
VMPKKLISEDIGYMGLMIDTEGNRIALHSRA